jgi:hypothetical protein
MWSLEANVRATVIDLVRVQECFVELSQGKITILCENTVAEYQTMLLFIFRKRIKMFV